MTRINSPLMAVLVSAGIFLCACNAPDLLQAREPVSDLAATATTAGLPATLLEGNTLSQTAVVGAVALTQASGEAIGTETGEVEVKTAAPTDTIELTAFPSATTQAEIKEEVPLASAETETPDPAPAATQESEEEEELEGETEPPCLAMRFVVDVTVPDGTVMPSDQSFFKIWRVQNIGTCTWASDFTIRYHGGFQLGAPSNMKLGESVAPGQYVNIGLQMYSPPQAGSFRGDWIMVSSSGDYFGIGENYDEPFYVEIIVSGSSNN
jgi:hypothetical protein